MIVGTFLNGRPALEHVCPRHLPDPGEKGTIRRLDESSRRNHPREYRIDQWLAI